MTKGRASLRGLAASGSMTIYLLLVVVIALGMGWLFVGQLWRALGAG